MDRAHNVQLARRAYYEKIADENLAPLWEVLKDLVTPEPRTAVQAKIWKFDRIKQLIGESGDIISAEEAERRVLVLENPGLPGKSRVTNSLFAGVQLILPGEAAEVHRHVSSAIRFVLDGEGAYTAVDGEKAMMSHGDFIITANWVPHDHGNPGTQPVIWLDVLDMPTVNHFDSSFAEHFDEKTQKITHEGGDSFDRYASGVLPEHMPSVSNRSPVVNYPFAKMQPILERLRKSRDIDRRHGARVRYTNPINGGPVLPTMGAYLALLPAGFSGEPTRSTDGIIFVCAKGEGTTIIDDQPFDWGLNDVFVAPPWKWFRHKSKEDSILFSISDKPAQMSLGLWREEIW